MRHDSISLWQWLGTGCVLVVGTLLGGVSQAWDWPSTGMLMPAKYGALYDTADEQSLLDGKCHALLAPTVEAYRHTLAEPVAVTRWSDQRSTWRILFATNRAPTGVEPEGQRTRFGNVVTESPTYGAALVELPGRQRGVSPDLADGTAAVEGQATRVTIPAVQTTSAAAFSEAVKQQVAASRQRDLLIFVHGFNVSFESALARTAQIALDMPFNGAVVAYAWPTQGGVTNYRSDEPLNAASTSPFAQFLYQLLTTLPGDTRIHVVVHSMGNRIVLRGINRLPPAPAGQPFFANIVLCAPDIGVSEFESLAEGVMQRARRVTLYACQGDTALKVSRQIHGERRAGETDPAVCVGGMETIDCSAVELDFLGHSYYGSNLDVLADLFALIKEDSPAAQRGHLKGIRRRGNEYFVFEEHPHRLLWTWHFDQLATRDDRMRR